MNKITDKQINHLAELSALKLTKEESDKMKSDLEQILDFVKKVESTDIASDKTEKASISLSELRDDVVEKSMAKGDALYNATQEENGYIIVPKVVE